MGASCYKMEDISRFTAVLGYSAAFFFDSLGRTQPAAIHWINGEPFMASDENGRELPLEEVFALEWPFES